MGNGVHTCDTEELGRLARTDVTGPRVRVLAGPSAPRSIVALAIGIAAVFHLGTDDSNGVDVGLGLSIAINKITSAVTATVEDGSQITASEGLEVRATNRTKVHADAGGFAIALTLANGDSSGASLAGGVSIAEARIDNDVISLIDRALVDASSVEVVADSSGVVESLTMAGAGSARVTVGSGMGFAGAVAVSWAGNSVDNTVSASIANALTRDRKSVV